MAAQEYYHAKPGSEVAGPGWNYQLISEEKINVAGRDLLYIIAKAVVGSACIGTAQLLIILVPGFIISWHDTIDSQGTEVSIIESVAAGTDKNAVQDKLCQMHRGLQVLFL